MDIYEPIPNIIFLLQRHFLFNLLFNLLFNVAMFGFMPAHTVDSVPNTMIYNAVPVEVKFNNMGPMKSSWGDAKGNLIKFGAFMLLLGAYSSFLSDYDYEPFPTGAGSNLEDADLANGFSRGQLINNALAASKFRFVVYH